MQTFHADLTEDFLNPKWNPLVVDSIIDSGDTMRRWLSEFARDARKPFKWIRNRVTIAVLTYNTTAKVGPDYAYDHFDRTTDKTYIKFWWEKK